MAVATARVTLKRRQWPAGDFFRRYKIVIDGSIVGMIKRRETKSFELPPGRHEIHLAIDFCRSRKLYLDLEPGKEVHLVCKARAPYTGWPNDYPLIDVVGSQPGTSAR